MNTGAGLGGTRRMVGWRGAFAWWQDPLHRVLALLGLAALLGGSGALNPLRDVLLEFVALALLVHLAWDGGWRDGKWIALALSGLVAFGVLQLVPLPPALWTAMPGRTFASEIAGAVAPGAWYPITLDSAATSRWLLALTVPVAAFLLARRLKRDDYRAILWSIVLIGCCSGLLGLAQLATGTGYLYQSAHNNFPVGIFANRNHQASLMAMATTITLILAADRLRVSRLSDLLWPYAPVLLLTVTIALLTQSRAGAALMLASVLPVLFVVRRNISARMAFAAIVVFAFAVVWVLSTGSGQGILARAARSGADERFVSWPDIWFLVTYHFPFGTGLGTFVRAYLPIETLATVSRTYVNHAHCDYLEILAEAGIAGAMAILVMAGFVAVCLWRALAHARQARRDHWELAAVSVLILLMAHSLVDYPARTFVLETIAAALAGMLSRTDPASRIGNRTPAMATGTLILVLAIAAAAQSARLNLGATFASVVGPSLPSSLLADADALALVARQASAAGDKSAAEVAAKRSLRIALYGSQALQTLGEVAAEKGDPRQAYRLLNLASRVTWRNSDVQLWAFNQSLSDGNVQAAIDAGDSLLRRGQEANQVMARFGAMTASPQARDLLARRLAESPPWAESFLQLIAGAGPETADTSLEFLEAAMKRGYRPDDAKLQRFFAQALALGKADEVVRLVRMANPGIAIDPQSAPLDIGFARVASGQALWGPFGWTVHDEAAYVDDDVTGSTVRGVSLHVGRTAGGNVLSQILLLPRGSYQFKSSTRITNGHDGRARWLLRCVNDNTVIGQVRLVDDAAASQGVPFTIPQRCPEQRLTLEALPVSGDMEVVLGKITLARQPAQ